MAHVIASILWSRIPKIALVSDTSNRPQHDVGSCLGLSSGLPRFWSPTWIAQSYRSAWFHGRGFLFGCFHILGGSYCGCPYSMIPTIWCSRFGALLFGNTHLEPAKNKKKHSKIRSRLGHLAYFHAGGDVLSGPSMCGWYNAGAIDGDIRSDLLNQLSIQVLGAISVADGEYLMLA